MQFKSGIYTYCNKLTHCVHLSYNNSIMLEEYIKFRKKKVCLK